MPPGPVSPSPPGAPDSPAAHAARAALTYRWDLLRAPCQAIVTEGSLAFSLLVAIRYFEAPEFVKSLLAGSYSFGLLLTPVGLWLVRRSGRDVSSAAALLFALSAFLLAAAAWAPGLWPFCLAVLLANTITAQAPPLFIQIYNTNYTPRERGRRLSRNIMAASLTAGPATWLGGKILDLDSGHYSALFLALACFALAAGWTGRRIPSAPLTQINAGNPWQNVSLIWRDPLFGYLLGSWMLLGLGNLMALPLRYEYLANPRYGIDLSNATIALVVVLVPSLFRVASAPLWGMIFDRFNFLFLRNLSNLFFLAGILVFFYSSTLPFLMVGTALTGLAMGGGNIAWNLWVTKIAPPEQVPSYMSVHTALTGVRGILAPAIGFLLIESAGPRTAAWLGATTLILSILLFSSLRRHPRLA